jgi:hypothetical protein
MKFPSLVLTALLLPALPALSGCRALRSVGIAPPSSVSESFYAKGRREKAAGNRVFDEALSATVSDQRELLQRAEAHYDQATRRFRQADDLGHPSVDERLLRASEKASDGVRRKLRELNTQIQRARDQHEVRQQQAQEQERKRRATRLRLHVATGERLLVSEYRPGNDSLWDELGQAVTNIATLQPDHPLLSKLRTKHQGVGARSVDHLLGEATELLRDGQVARAWSSAFMARARKSGQRVEEVNKLLRDIRLRCAENKALLEHVGMARWFYTPAGRTSPVSVNEFFLDSAQHRVHVLEFAAYTVIEEIEPGEYLALVDDRSASWCLVVAPNRNLMSEQRRMGGRTLGILARFIERRRVSSKRLPRVFPRIVPVFQLLH